MNTLKICEKCRNKTKYISGFWDGENGGGYMYTCDSKICPIAARRDKKALEAMLRKRKVQNENFKNGVSAQYFAQKRREARLLLKEVSDHTGLSPAELSAYENEREPIPVDLYDRLTRLSRRVDGHRCMGRR